MDEKPKHDQTPLSAENPTAKSEQTGPANLSPPKSRYHHRQHSEEHPQTKDLPTPSDTDRPTFSQPAGVLGSPKLAFTPGYPSRFPSSELSKSFDLHTQTGTTESERAILRNIDIQRILNSAGILGYDVDFGEEAPFDGPAVILYSRNSDPVARFKALTVSFGNELRRLEPFLARQTSSDLVGDGGDPEWRRWKEVTVLRLLTIITPAMGRFLERLTATAGGAIGQHDGGVRFFVGDH
ncbi:hypothetical protein KC318_g3858 [Hortaea werneckii]|nr:hypothetical protein KC334_g11766 [Hortaea werneckii]KAI7017007.1 hypothetical protein KC355_g3800 [Hortaea werneckii]KAI7192803.1 hypothetical protein KC324_g5337 [Hortaea werneckii]KAI7587107.1 hypothetical protein KC316_g5233 [Hortaea werneckii]KAI7670776.1 hypothetical protein KC318_g3858 [Hortaea werneckii]